MPGVTFADTDSRAGPSRVAVCVSPTALFPFFFFFFYILKKSNGYSGNCLIISVFLCCQLCFPKCCHMIMDLLFRGKGHTLVWF